MRQVMLADQDLHVHAEFARFAEDFDDSTLGATPPLGKRVISTLTTAPSSSGRRTFLLG